MKERAAVDSELEILSRFRRELEEQLQSLKSEKELGLKMRLKELESKQKHRRKLETVGQRQDIHKVVVDNDIQEE
ncbi:hypothetical protein HAX54_000226 [Datura stramonium]|uniref:Uncharacterized protein n=1 Tax=Datura stramonium TaxID=4076 RepID=A0ABS8WUK9_DATST|nr:hypothetical protein [Datura stramonium]